MCQTKPGAAEIQQTRTAFETRVQAQLHGDAFSVHGDALSGQYNTGRCLPFCSTQEHELAAYQAYAERDAGRGSDLPRPTLSRFLSLPIDHSSHRGFCAAGLLNRFSWHHLGQVTPFNLFDTLERHDTDNRLIVNDDL